MLAVFRNAADNVNCVALSTDATVTPTATLPLESSETWSPTLIPVVEERVTVNCPVTTFAASGPVVV